jgi:hypothetical protein
MILFGQPREGADVIGEAGADLSGFRRCDKTYHIPHQPPEPPQAYEEKLVQVPIRSQFLTPGDFRSSPMPMVKGIHKVRGMETEKEFHSRLSPLGFWPAELKILSPPSLGHPVREKEVYLVHCYYSGSFH